MSDYILRDKYEALQLLADKGFNPDLIMDVGAGEGTLGLYEVWPNAHYVMIEPLAHYEAALAKIRDGLLSAEVKITALARIMQPIDPHAAQSAAFA